MLEEESDWEGAHQPLMLLTGADGLHKMPRGGVETHSGASLQAPGAAQEYTAL